MGIKDKILFAFYRAYLKHVSKPALYKSKSYLEKPCILMTLLSFHK